LTRRNSAAASKRGDYCLPHTYGENLDTDVAAGNSPWLTNRYHLVASIDGRLKIIDNQMVPTESQTVVWAREHDDERESDITHDSLRSIEHNTDPRYLFVLSLAQKLLCQFLTNPSVPG